MRNVDDTLKYYHNHRPGATRWPFNPDGLCLKVCRVARDIEPMFPSAISAQLGTPLKYRVKELKDVRRGMVMYFDDPNDDNPFGHIATCLGREKETGAILTWTNSVEANNVVVVRANFYPSNWGDRFQFASWWLNGVELDTGRTTIQTDPKYPLGRLEKAIDMLMSMITYHKREGHDRLVEALKRDLEELRQTVRRYGK